MPGISMSGRLKNPASILFTLMAGIIPFETMNLFYREGMEQKLKSLRNQPA
jgi:hypothetical protein